MANACDPEALESLLRAELPVERAADLEAHVATCPACERELAWLRVERGLFAARAAPSTGALWKGVEPRLGATTAVVDGAAQHGPRGEGPYRAAVLVPPPRRSAWRDRGLVAAAACFVGAALGAAAVAAWNAERSRAAPAVAGDHPPDRPRARATRASAPVSGPVTLRLETLSADVTVDVASSLRVDVEVDDGDARWVELVADGGAYAVRFDGAARLGSGAVRVTLPRGSALSVATASGDVTVGAVGGDLRVHTASGDVRAARAAVVAVETSSGDVRVDAVTGAVRVRTASGDVVLAHEGDAVPRLDVLTTSGALTWRGRCGQGCRLDVRSTSGDAHLGITPGSGFALRYTTVSGDLTDGVGTGIGTPLERGGTVEGRVGDGAGAVECATVSGGLTLARE